MKNRLKKRGKDTHKGDYGRVFILAGSPGLTGAAALCSVACLRAGAGLVTLGIPVSLNIAMEKKLTEVMTCPLPETRKGTFSLKAKAEILNIVKKSNAVILGPGLSRNPETSKLVRILAGLINKPMILDADALNALSEDTAALKKIAHHYIITPHAGEMARLIKKSTSFIKNNRINVAKKFSSQYNAVVVLKGAGTVVTDPSPKSKAYVNKTGNPGMATAGTGDVLTGVIGGFLAQGLDTSYAAKLGVYVHGLAGDLAAKDKGEIGLIASDILERIPAAINTI
ncbi:MAG: NAD(P)H-hydrate dehydratase, partial [Candidatus Omnitrophota bacterium]|nr:NAD(P)H-hydrate dehydratase [Candidatus Omnitrophota bacterium]